MSRKTMALALVLAALSGTAFAGTSGEGFKTGTCALDPGAILPGSTGRVIHVPGDAGTIQAGVDLANEGDTVLIGPGVYHEAVKVRTPGLRIRGTDRNAVVLDGESTLDIGIDATQADRTLIENMTAHHFRRHGFFWFQDKGYWGRYLTAYNNGLYGIYAFDSRCGQLDHSYTSGNADSGFYIGECYPCDAVVTDIVAERNALGYSGTNAGGNLTLRDSIWRNNAMGIVPNSLDGESRPPQQGVIIRNNTVENNNNQTAPGVSIAGTYYGAGIVIAGGENNQVYGNAVTNHLLAGIAIAPLPDQHVWIPSGNTIWGNTVSHDAVLYPDSYDLAQAAVAGPNNCWADNAAATTAPAVLTTVWACGQMQTAPGGDPRVEAALAEGAAGINGRAPSDWRTWAPPGPQAQQPDDNGDGDFSNDGAVDRWLPALGL